MPFLKGGFGVTNFVDEKWERAKLKNIFLLCVFS
jgi:hypothetical protein